MKICTKRSKKIVATIRVNGILDQSQSFVVCQGIDEILPINDDLVFHYKKRVNAKKVRMEKLIIPKEGSF